MKLTKKELCKKVTELGIKCVELQGQLEKKHIKPIHEEGIFQMDETLDLGGNVVSNFITIK